MADRVTVALQTPDSQPLDQSAQQAHTIGMHTAVNRQRLSWPSSPCPSVPCPPPWLDPQDEPSWLCADAASSSGLSVAWRRMLMTCFAPFAMTMAAADHQHRRPTVASASWTWQG